MLRDGFFVTSDTSADPRLDGHVYQGVIQAYHGVPLLDDRGELFGTLCHFDTDSYGLPDEEQFWAPALSCHTGNRSSRT